MKPKKYFRKANNNVFFCEIFCNIGAKISIFLNLSEFFSN